MSTPSGSTDVATPRSGFLGRLADYLVPLAWANLVANMALVVTGAAVRVTGSGLGCPTWPRCTDDSFVPHQALGIHGVIEFGNRTLTGVLAVLAVLLLLAALGSANRRVIVLSSLVVFGIPLQAVIGGITVRTQLNPYVVAFHLLLSFAIIAICVLLLDTLRGPARPTAVGVLGRLPWLLYAVTWLVLWLGTVVTGSGPHSGDLNSRRTGLDTELVSRVHALSVWLLIALTIGLVFVARKASASQPQSATAVGKAVGLLLIIELAQGLVGYVQYFLGLPVAVVLLHMLGSALTIAVSTWVLVSSRARA